MHLNALTHASISHQLTASRRHLAGTDIPHTVVNEPPPVLNSANEPALDPADTQPRREPETGSSLARPRHQRRHVQQYLRQLDRIVRHEIRRELKTAEGLDPETSSRIKELAKEFRHGLRDTYLAAGRGHDFDPAAILTGLSETVVGLTEGLRALNVDQPAVVVPSPEDENSRVENTPVEIPNEPAILPYEPVQDPRQSPTSIISLQA